MPRNSGFRGAQKLPDLVPERIPIWAPEERIPLWKPFVRTSINLLCKEQKQHTVRDGNKTVDDELYSRGS